MRYAITLYVSSRSVSSKGVENRLRKQVADAGVANRVDIIVRDLSVDPAAGQDDGVAYTPSIVIRLSTGERRVIVGDLRDTSVLAPTLQLICG